MPCLLAWLPLPAERKVGMAEGSSAAIQVFPAVQPMLADWHEEKPWWTGGAGLRNRVGMRHVPLADLLHAFLDAGLTIEKVVEPEPELALPAALALRLVKAS